jgi:hypothetical protein
MLVKVPQTRKFVPSHFAFLDFPSCASSVSPLRFFVASAVASDVTLMTAL